MPDLDSFMCHSGQKQNMMSMKLPSFANRRKNILLLIKYLSKTNTAAEQNLKRPLKLKLPWTNEFKIPEAGTQQSN